MCVSSSRRSLFRNGLLNMSLRSYSHDGARRHGHQSGCSTVRLPLEPAVRGRRAIILYFPGTAQKYDVRLLENTEHVGLKNHLEKTTIVSKKRSNRRNEVTIDNIKVEVLPVKERAKYLCQTITLEQQETTAIKNRIRAAWASLTKYRQELTSKTYLLRNRLHLFNMVISPTLTYASETWTLSNKHEKLIR